jgi:teichuronic acid biosynthesis glycosyltransferase TuaC
MPYSVGGDIGLQFASHIIFAKGYPLVLRKPYSLEPISGEKETVRIASYFEFPFTSCRIGLYSALRRIVEEERIDLVVAHATHYGWGAFLLWKKLGLPYVVVSHGSDVHQLHKGPNRAYQEAKRILENAQKALFVSKFLMNRCIDLGIDCDGEVIPNGFRPPKIQPVKKNFEDFVLGFVGGLIEIKRARFLPDILEKVLLHIPTARMVLVGDGSGRIEVEKAIEEKNLQEKIQLLGRVDHQKVMATIAGLDVLLLPSRNEGMGIVILEANSQGVPVVGSANGGIPETLGDGGLLVEDGPQWIEDFAQAIIKLHHEPIPSDTLVKRVQGMTWEQTVQKEIRVFESVVTSRRPAL